MRNAQKELRSVNLSSLRLFPKEASAAGLSARAVELQVHHDTGDRQEQDRQATQ